MHLLINGLSARLGGGQTYLYQLLRHLPADWKITLLSSGGLKPDEIPAHITYVVKPALANPFLRAWWERAKLEAFAESCGCKMIFNPACLLPVMKSSRIKTAVIFQNMLPFDEAQQRAYPRFSYRRLRDNLLKRGLVSAMQRADLVVFISTYARESMARKQIIPRAAITVPHGVEEKFFVNTALPDGFVLKDEPYFLYVSFLDFYKCQREVLAAYSELKTKQKIREKLLFVGSGYSRYVELVKQDISALGLQEDVILLGNVRHETLPALYGHATLNLFASTCENCPNILLEIMASGAPALVSNHGPMPELAGDTVTYVDPRNHTEFVSKWAEMLRNMGAAKANAARAAARAKTYRWEAAVAQTARAMENVVGGQ